MNPLPAHPSELRWSQLSTKGRAYELKLDNELLGRLSFDGCSGSRATAETAHGSWTLMREGFLSPRSKVRPTGDGPDLGMLTALAIQY